MSDGEILAWPNFTSLSGLLLMIPSVLAMSVKSSSSSLGSRLIISRVLLTLFTRDSRTPSLWGDYAGGLLHFNVVSFSFKANFSKHFAPSERIVLGEPLLAQNLSRALPVASALIPLVASRCTARHCRQVINKIWNAPPSRVLNGPR